jgi:hypothetical protein
MLETLVLRLINRRDLDRDAMIAETQRARRKALKAAEAWGYGQIGPNTAKAAWETVEELGRLLSFLTFRKRPAGAKRAELHWYDVLERELMRREATAPTRSGREKSSGRPLPRGAAARLRGSLGTKDV